MIRLFIPILFSLGLFLYVSYSDTMNVKSSYKVWAKISKVERIERNNPKLGMDGTYIFWVVTVILNDSYSSKIRVDLSPIPKVDNCLPVIVKEFYAGEPMTILDGERWRFAGLKTAPCLEQ